MISTSTQLASVRCRITRKCEGATASNRVSTSGIDAYDATDAKTFLHVSHRAARHRVAVAARSVECDVAGECAGSAFDPGFPLDPPAAVGGDDRAVRRTLHSRRLPAVRGIRGGRLAPWRRARRRSQPRVCDPHRRGAREAGTGRLLAGPEGLRQAPGHLSARRAGPKRITPADP